MEQSIYSDPAHNLGCSYRFTCAAARCPEAGVQSDMPACHIEKFIRYQPDNDEWYRRNWEEVNRITWVEVFSLKEAWVYILYIVIISVFMYMAMLLIKLVSRFNGYF